MGVLRSYTIVREGKAHERLDCPHPRTSRMCCAHRLGPGYQRAASFNRSVTTAECVELEQFWVSATRARNATSMTVIVNRIPNHR